MKKIKNKKIVVIAVIVLIVMAGFVFIISGGKVKSVFPHHPITLGLPMASEYDNATDLIPLGETINHPNTPGGHPGIDFLWTKDTPIIAMADGTVTKTEPADDSHGKYDVSVVSGIYEIHYNELDELAPGLGVNTKLSKGDFIGYPQLKGHGLHLEFVFAGKRTKLLKKELCPITYFDKDSLARINTIWANAAGGSHAEMKTRFPKICNGFYDNLHEPDWLLTK